MTFMHEVVCESDVRLVPREQWTVASGAVLFVRLRCCRSNQRKSAQRSGTRLDGPHVPHMLATATADGGTAFQRASASKFHTAPQDAACGFFVNLEVHVVAELEGVEGRCGLAVRLHMPRGHRWGHSGHQLGVSKSTLARTKDSHWFMLHPDVRALMDFLLLAGGMSANAVAGILRDAMHALQPSYRRDRTATLVVLPDAAVAALPPTVDQKKLAAALLQRQAVHKQARQRAGAVAAAAVLPRPDAPPSQAAAEAAAAADATDARMPSPSPAQSRAATLSAAIPALMAWMQALTPYRWEITNTDISTRRNDLIRAANGGVPRTQAFIDAFTSRWTERGWADVKCSIEQDPDPAKVPIAHVYARICAPANKEVLAECTETSNGVRFVRVVMGDETFNVVAGSNASIYTIACVRPANRKTAVLGHVISESFAITHEAATAIMADASMQDAMVVGFDGGGGARAWKSSTHHLRATFASIFGHTVVMNFVTDCEPSQAAAMWAHMRANTSAELDSGWYAEGGVLGRLRQLLADEAPPAGRHDVAGVGMVSVASDISVKEARVLLDDGGGGATTAPRPAPVADPPEPAVATDVLAELLRPPWLVELRGRTASDGTTMRRAVAQALRYEIAALRTALGGKYDHWAAEAECFCKRWQHAARPGSSLARLCILLQSRIMLCFFHCTRAMGDALKAMVQEVSANALLRAGYTATGSVARPRGVRSATVTAAADAAAAERAAAPLDGLLTMLTAVAAGPAITTATPAATPAAGADVMVDAAEGGSAGNSTQTLTDADVRTFQDQLVAVALLALADIISAPTKAAFTANWEHFVSLLGTVWPSAVAYLRKNWMDDGSSVRWAHFWRHGREMFGINSTNGLEALHNLIKAVILGGGVCRSLLEAARLLVGDPDNHSACHRSLQALLASEHEAVLEKPYSCPALRRELEDVERVDLAWQEAQRGNMNSHVVCLDPLRQIYELRIGAAALLNGSRATAEAAEHATEAVQAAANAMLLHPQHLSTAAEVLGRVRRYEKADTGTYTVDLSRRLCTCSQVAKRCLHQQLVHHIVHQPECRLFAGEVVEDYAFALAAAYRSRGSPVAPAAPPPPTGATALLAPPAVGTVEAQWQEAVVELMRTVAAISSIIDTHAGTTLTGAPEEALATAVARTNSLTAGLKQQLRFLGAAKAGGLAGGLVLLEGATHGGLAPAAAETPGSGGDASGAREGEPVDPVRAGAAGALTRMYTARAELKAASASQKRGGMLSGTLRGHQLRAVVANRSVQPQTGVATVGTGLARVAAAGDHRSDHTAPLIPAADVQQARERVLAQLWEVTYAGGTTPALDLAPGDSSARAFTDRRHSTHACLAALVPSTGLPRVSVAAFTDAWAAVNSAVTRRSTAACVDCQRTVLLWHPTHVEDGAGSATVPSGLLVRPDRALWPVCVRSHGHQRWTLVAVEDKAATLHVFGSGDAPGAAESAAEAFGALFHAGSLVCVQHAAAAVDDDGGTAAFVVALQLLCGIPSGACSPCGTGGMDNVLTATGALMAAAVGRGEQALTLPCCTQARVVQPLASLIETDASAADVVSPDVAAGSGTRTRSANASGRKRARPAAARQPASPLDDLAATAGAEAHQITV
jgi:hypothetical protein